MLKKAALFLVTSFIFSSAFAQTSNTKTIDLRWSEQAETMTVNEIESMKNNGFNFRGIDESGNTLFYYVMTHNPDPELIAKMIEVGADPNQKAANGMVPLNVATSKANELQLQILMLQTMGLDVLNPQIKDTLEEKIYLEMQQMFALAKLLVEKGADVNRMGPLGTPLMNAATNAWNLDIVNLLIESGADVNKIDAEGRSALFYAAAGGNDQIIDTLLKAGANPSIVDTSGKTYKDVVKTAVEQPL